MIGEGPFKEAVENTEGVVLQELRTYRIKDGVVHLDVATRRYFNGDDYNDSVTYRPLNKIDD